MIFKTSKDIVYAKYEPTVFVVSSPFQLICARNAINVFCIKDYKFVFVLFPNVVRNEQLFAMAEEMHILYELVYTDAISQIDFFNSKGFFSQKKGNYRRAFLGSYFRSDFPMIASLYMTDGYMAFLDDGTSTLSLFIDGYFSSDNPKPSSLLPKIKWYKNVWYKEKKLFFKISNKVAESRNHVTNCFFTIYDDVKTRKFQTYPNKLSKISDVYTFTQSNIVFIIGPFIKRESQWNGIEEAAFLKLLSYKLMNVSKSYPEHEIIYIPHGSDTSAEIQAICESNGIQYKRINAAIEYWFIQNLYKPYAIYGFGSTALLNLKRMFPDVPITDWFIDKPHKNPYYSFYKMIADYYGNNEIVIEKIIN